MYTHVYTHTVLVTSQSGASTMRSQRYCGAKVITLAGPGNVGGVSFLLFLV